MGCWIGKGLGGTLGMPFEGCMGPLMFRWRKWRDICFRMTIWTCIDGGHEGEAHDDDDRHRDEKHDDRIDHAALQLLHDVG